MKFDFIIDKGFQSILKRDYDELLNCIGVKASKASLLLSGSIAEAVLSDYYTENLPSGKSKDDILRWSLGNLLDHAVNDGLISTKEKHLGIIIKDYRNLIHPGKEIRTNEEFGFETAKLSKILLDIIISKLRDNHFNRYGYNSDEIIEKLKSDWEFRSIFGIVITKLDHNEREKLLSQLVNFEVLFKSNLDYYKVVTGYDPRAEIKELENIEDVKSRVNELKPLIRVETIEEHLGNLKDSVIKGESVRALALYNLFHEDLNYFSTNDQEMIAIYMLTLFESLLEDSRVFVSDKTYSTIGKYIHSAEGKNRILAFGKFCLVNFGGTSLIEQEMDVFQQVFNSLSQDIQKAVVEDIENSLPESKEDLTKWKTHYFYDEAVKRQIIDEKYSS